MIDETYLALLLRLTDREFEVAHRMAIDMQVDAQERLTKARRNLESAKDVVRTTELAAVRRLGHTTTDTAQEARDA